MESPDDQVYSKQTRNIKQSKKQREKIISEMGWDPKSNKDPVEKKVWLASSKNTFGFKDEAKQTTSSSFQNTLSNYF